MCYKMKCLTIRDGYLFKNWPVTYRWDELQDGSGGSDVGASNCPPKLQPDSSQGEPAQEIRASIRERVKRSSSKMVRYVIAYSLGRWILYPGSVCLFNNVPLSSLVKGRTNLMEDFQGIRAKLITRDGNAIDTMFVDRRDRKDPWKRGTQLVICCEGNSSFYEIGCFFTPLKAGYSVLGWNHPGYARSTGKPYPKNDINAMEVVVRYGVHCLNFSLADISIYGYSLGSYTASWAAMNYPKLGGLILDASFDGLIPLVMRMIDKSWQKLVLRTMMEHFNLNVAEQLCNYPGPVLLIRRTLDEITSTQFSLENNLPLVQTNRANQLLLQLLNARYPAILSGTEETLQRWLSADKNMEPKAYRLLFKVDDKWCLQMLQSYKESLGPNTDFPWGLGSGLPFRQKQQLALFLAKKHMKSVEATHRRPLPSKEFQLPWKL